MSYCGAQFVLQYLILCVTEHTLAFCERHPASDEVKGGAMVKLPLSSHRVEAAFKACLFPDGDDTRDRVVVEGIDEIAWFHRVLIDQHRQEIHDMLAELPDEFRLGGRSGMSFLIAYWDRHRNQWTKSQQILEKLIMLGIAINEVEYSVPRDMWSALPGGKPYILIRQ